MIWYEDLKTCVCECFFNSEINSWLMNIEWIVGVVWVLKNKKVSNLFQFMNEFMST